MNICDAIEQFLLDAFSEDGVVLISRNNLAQHFDCAPSQINYVLTTRFTADMGLSHREPPRRGRIHRNTQDRRQQGRLFKRNIVPRDRGRDLLPQGAEHSGNTRRAKRRHAARKRAFKPGDVRQFPVFAHRHQRPPAGADPQKYHSRTHTGETKTDAL